MPPGAQQVSRIARHTVEHRADDLSGCGAKITGDRWNSKGNAVVYATTSIAHATFETLAYRGDNSAIRNTLLIRVDIPALNRHEFVRHLRTSMDFPYPYRVTKYGGASKLSDENRCRTLICQCLR